MKKKKKYDEQQYTDSTLYFCITSLVNPYLKKQAHVRSITQ